MKRADSRYELFDHTADVGIRVFAPTLPGLVRPAVEGLYSVIGELAATGAAAPFGYHRLARDRPGAALLLRDYLAELPAFFEQDQRMVTHVEVRRFDDEGLTVSGQTALVDKARSVYHREVKAITYYALEIRQTADGYQATFIVDI